MAPCTSWLCYTSNCCQKWLSLRTESVFLSLSYGVQQARSFCLRWRGQSTMSLFLGLTIKLMCGYFESRNLQCKQIFWRRYNSWALSQAKPIKEGLTTIVLSDWRVHTVSSLSLWGNLQLCILHLNPILFQSKFCCSSFLLLIWIFWKEYWTE